MEGTIRRRVVRLAAGFAVAVGISPAAAQDPLVREGATEQVSAHVHVIQDQNVPLVPNVGIVVGTEATLVVDTGLGPRNGERIRREVDHLTDNALLYAVPTHYHPEHSLGVGGLGPDTQVVLPHIQLEEMAGGSGIRDAFASRSALTAELLDGVEYPEGDLLFDDELTLDLGGVTARVFTLGGTLHTRGDALVWIDDERVLFAGDIVMQNIFPSFTGAGDDGSVQRWLDALDRLEALDPQIIIGAHTDRGGASLIAAWREYFETVQTRVAQLRSEGRTVEEAADTLTAELEARYPDWRGANRVAGAVRAAWND